MTRIALADGSATPVASGLAQPEGIAVDADGSLLVVEVAAKQLKRIDAQDGGQTVIAADLPIGLSNGPSLYRSVAVSPSAIYFNSDIDNSVYGWWRGALSPLRKGRGDCNPRPLIPVTGRLLPSALRR